MDEDNFKWFAILVLMLLSIMASLWVIQLKLDGLESQVEALVLLVGGRHMP